MLGRCCWVKKYIEHELWSIVIRGTTYSNQKHPLGWGRGGEVSNSTGYRSAGSWRSGEEGNIPLESSWGRARAMGRRGEGRKGEEGEVR
jgi:hypothetical protein